MWTNPEAAKWAAQDWVWRWCGKLQHCTAVQYRMSRQKGQEPYLPLRCPCKAEIKVIGRENEMTGAGGIGKQKPPVKEKCTSSLNVTLANYKEEGGLPFAVCCSRPYIVYQTVKKLHFCLIACVGRPLVARQLTAATHFPGQFSYDAPPDRKQRLCLGEAVSALRCHCGARIPRPGPPFPRCAHPCGKTEKRRIYLHRIPHVRQKLAFSALHCKETGRGRQCDPCAVHGAL